MTYRRAFSQVNEKFYSSETVCWDKNVTYNISLFIQNQHSLYIYIYHYYYDDDDDDDDDNDDDDDDDDDDYYYYCERFEPRSHFKSRLSLIVRVNVVLNRTVVVDSDVFLFSFQR